jgi:hypothetical protein
MTPAEQKIHDKIRKVANLAERAGTEGEAQAAMIALQNLLRKHNLTLKDIQSPEGPEQTVDTLVVDTQGMKVHWRGWLGRVIADNFRCEVYWGGGYGRKYRLCFMGMSNDVTIAQASYVAATLTIERLKEHYVDRRAAERRAEGGYWSIQDGQYAAKAWKAGFIEGLAKALSANAQKTSLVLLKDVRVTEAKAGLSLTKGAYSNENSWADNHARTTGRKEGDQYARAGYGKNLLHGNKELNS